MLIEQGASVNAATTAGDTPLHLAAQDSKNGASITSELIKAGSNVIIQNSMGWTPLHCAMCVVRHSAPTAAPNRRSVVHGDIRPAGTPTTWTWPDCSFAPAPIPPPKTSVALLPKTWSSAGTSALPAFVSLDICASPRVHQLKAASRSDPHVVESLIEAGKFHSTAETTATLAEADLADIAERRKQ